MSSITIDKGEHGYASAIVSFSPVHTVDVGDIQAWGSAEKSIELMSFGCREFEGVTYANITYEVRATCASETVGFIPMRASVSGEIAEDKVLMRNLFTEFMNTMCDREACGESLVWFTDGKPAFEKIVIFPMK